jgi:hypothetical protein
MPITSLDSGSYNADDVVQPSVLCYFCEKVRSWMQANAAIITALTERTAATKPFEHHPDGRTLESSYHKGRHLCCLIWSSLLGFNTSKSGPDVREEVAEWLRKCRCITIHVEWINSSYSSLSLVSSAQHQPSNAFRWRGYCLRIMKFEES